MKGEGVGVRGLGGALRPWCRPDPVQGQGEGWVAGQEGPPAMLQLEERFTLAGRKPRAWLVCGRGPSRQR